MHSPITLESKDAEIQCISLYQRLPSILHLHILPFCILYSSLLYLYCIRPQEDVIVSLYGAFLIFLHAMVLLLAEWNLDFYCWVTCIPVRDIKSLQDARKLTMDDINRDKQFTTGCIVAKVIPSHPSYSKQLCLVFFTKSTSNSQDERPKREIDTDSPTFVFYYNMVQFCYYDAIEQLECKTSTPMIHRLIYPTQKPLQYYTEATGLMTSTDISMLGHRYGRNDFEIPFPSFLTMLKEQVVAPFFVFQFFCMLLWCLDEYVYYSIVTMGLLVVFECTTVVQRQRNMMMLQRMRRSPVPILVYREKNWVQIWSDTLVPGDICSLRSSNNTFENPQLPCDFLLLRGSCIVNEAMLTGETVPLRKEALEADEDVDSNVMMGSLSIDEGTAMLHKKSVLFGGTEMLQHTSGSSPCCAAVPPAPNDGCIAFVLRTGFGTAQGSLMRTILYSSERMTANTVEALFFILMLLAFAVVAVIYVLVYTLYLDTSVYHNRFKLVLHCLMILTSVVPPELPMELSLAVTNSLIELTKAAVYCTEPFRIPFAGRIDICCFDKTGTITSDKLIMEGVVIKTSSSSNNGFDLIETQLFNILQTPDVSNAEIILAGCHSLVLLNGRLSGDPLELAVMSSISWNMRSIWDSQTSSLRALMQSSNNGKQLNILKRYAFSSDLQRMTTIVQVENTSSEYRILTKGSPEALALLLKQLPSHYTQTYRQYAHKGYRVLALAYRIITQNEAKELQSQSRHHVERQLIFAGFLVLKCPIKHDSQKTISELKLSKHAVMMVTGDSELTAVDVAKRVGILDAEKKILMLQVNAKTNEIYWVDLDIYELDLSDQHFPKSVFNGLDGMKDVNMLVKTRLGSKEFSVNNISMVSSENNLVITGKTLELLQQTCNQNTEGTDTEGLIANKVQEMHVYMQLLQKLCPHVHVFARTSPQQKEWILMALNKADNITLMCGDGTNDVGALKQAHVGISIVNCQIEYPNPLKQSLTSRIIESHQSTGLRQRRHSQNATIDDILEESMPESTIIKLGDASIASPFTTKSSSIRVTKRLIRHGRCTLVTTIQMYKILGVNCLVTAYYLSTLYLIGVKNGDQQLTILGIIIAIFFLLLSKTKPAKKLASEKPPHGVFCAVVLASIMVQFLVHVLVLFAALSLATPYIDRKDPAMHPNGPFQPNIINSIMFLVSTNMQVTTFVANYRGLPFMQSFSSHTGLKWLSIVTYIVLLVALFNVFSFVGDILELVALPSTRLQLEVFCLIFGDTIATLGIVSFVEQSLKSKY